MPYGKGCNETYIFNVHNDTILIKYRAGIDSAILSTGKHENNFSTKIHKNLHIFRY